MVRTIVIGLCAFVSLGALIFGMDGGYFSGVLAMHNFIEDFGSLNPVTHAYYISAGRQSFMNSFPYLGQLLAALSGGLIADLLGRKWGLVIMVMTSVCGVLMQLFARHEALFVTGRFVNYIAVGFATIFVPIYQAECSPRGIRGVMITLYQLNIVLGSFIMAIVNNFTKDIKGDASYRIPIGVLLTLPILMLPGIPFLPESPRWLLKKGRVEEARRSLTIIHKDDVGFSVNDEMLFLQTAIREQLEINDVSSWADCFKGTNRRRTFLACFIQIWQQFTGISFIFNYGTVFFSQIGISKPFTVTIIQNLTNLIGTIVSFFLIDSVGRRPLLLAGSVVMFIGHIAVGICGILSDGNLAAQRGIVAFVLIYVFGFAFSWGPLGWVITSEVSTSRLREKTQALGSASNIIFSFAISYTLPYLTSKDKADLGPKVGFIFATLVLLGAIWTYIYVPETKGRALEELDEMFQNRIPSRRFKEYRVTGVASVVDAIEHHVDVKGDEVLQVEVASYRSPVSTATSEKHVYT